MADSDKEKAVRDALNTVRNIRDANFRVRELINLLSVLPSPVHEQVIQEIFSIISDTKDEYLLPNVISDLVKVLPADQMIHLVMITKKIRSPFDKANVLAEIAPFVPAHLMQKCITIASEIQDKRYREQGLAALLPYIQEDDKRKVLKELIDSVASIEDYIPLAYSLSSIVPHLEEKIKVSAASHLQSVLHKTQNDVVRIKVLSNFNPGLRPEEIRQLIQNAYETSSKSKTPYFRARQFADIALSPIVENKAEASQLAWREIMAIDDLGERLLLLSEVAQLTSPSTQMELVNTVLSTEYEELGTPTFSIVVANILRYVPENVQPYLLNRALKRIFSLASVDERHQAIAPLANFVPSKIRAQAMSSFYNRLNFGSYARFISYLPWLEKEEQVPYFQQIVFASLGFDEIESLFANWAQIAYEGLMEITIPFLHNLAERNRGSNLIAGAGLSLALSIITGKDLTSEAYRAITDVTRWWP